MPTYATQTDCLAYIVGLVIDDPAAFDQLIDRAEKDIDGLFLRRNIVAATGRRWDVTDLNIPASSIQGLRDATCAQVEYRLTQGPTFFTEAQYKSVKGPDFTTTGQLPIVGPKAKRELIASGVIPTQARSIP